MGTSRSRSNENQESDVVGESADSIRQRSFDPSSYIFESLVSGQPPAIDKTDLEDEEFERFVKDLIRRIVEIIFGDFEAAAAALRSTHHESFRDLEDRFGISRETVRRRLAKILESFDDL